MRLSFLCLAQKCLASPSGVFHYYLRSFISAVTAQAWSPAQSFDLGLRKLGVRMAFKPYSSQAYQHFRHSNFPLAFHPRMSRTNESKKWKTKFQNLTKFTQQPLSTSSEQKHTEHNSTTWWPPSSLFFFFFPNIMAWDHPLSFLLNFLVKVCCMDSLVGIHAPQCPFQQKSQTEFCFYLLTDSKQA